MFISGGRFIGCCPACPPGSLIPCCPCSAVPLFIGFVTAGIPLGVTFSFLIAAPMVNEIALGLLYGLLGRKVVAIFIGVMGSGIPFVGYLFNMMI